MRLVIFLLFLTFVEVKASKEISKDDQKRSSGLAAWLTPEPDYSDFGKKFFEGAVQEINYNILLSAQQRARQMQQANRQLVRDFLRQIQHEDRSCSLWHTLKGWLCMNKRTRASYLKLNKIKVY